MLRFKLFGISVSVDPWFWLVSAVFISTQVHGLAGIGMLVLWVLALFLAILWHELGHALMQKKFGASLVEIHLQAMGGQTTGNRTFTRRQSILTALAGPAIGLLLWGLLRYLLIPSLRTENAMILFFTDSLAGISFYWSLISLAPVLPLDGGRVLEAAVEKPSGWIHRFGFVAAILCGLGFFVYFQQVFLLLFFGYLAFENFRAMQSSASWMPEPAWRGSGDTAFREEPRPAVKRSKKYEPKLRPRAELDKEHPAVVEIDALLDKISRDGFGSLSGEEKKLLDLASAELKAKDQRR